MHLLGIDLGTSSIKAVLMNDQQVILGSNSQALAVTRPQVGWSEQDPADWLTAVDHALQTLQQAHPQAMADVQGLALSGQMHGATLVDAQNQVLRPCILWNDTRSYQEAAALDANPIFRQLSGNIVFPGFTAPKLVWVQKHEPALFAKLHKLLLPKDYVRWWLTGEYASDMSDAAGTAWLDVAKRAWSPELLASSGMRIEQMPQVLEGTAVSGYLHPRLAERWGIKQRVVVAGGAGDNAAAACGMGTVTAGSAFVSLGTSGVLFAATARYLPNPESAVHTFCHALPNTWHQMGVILSATDSLNWYAQIANQSPIALTQALGENLKPPSRVSFLPYLSGERTPHNDAKIRGAFTGLSHADQQVDLTQAVLEGVAFAIRDNLAALKAAGSHLERVTAVGGGSRSPYWLKVLATTLNLPIDLPAEGDFGAAFGAARLALIAATQAEPFSVLTAPAVAQTIEPETQFIQAFNEAYAHYQHLYPALKGASL
ncbi:xylulokinase [Thiothrix eikelboomii]|uniref:Xylulose kinase n=1 Tax=Thiothrix eikelboomii TaxID=92487 RepID=A0A1T4XVK6_9GAMM|nr:xylulokinase [Thiothrix eikelboomii]SKA93592.1 xylulokinase [Thiothrix eikelboomii]